MSEGAMLVVTPALVPAVVFGPGGIDAILEKVKTEARAEEVDISTKGGRAACASLAYKIARSKTALDDMGKSLGEEMRRQVDAINLDRRRVRDELDALRDEIRSPLDLWEAREDSRIEGHRNEVARITALAHFDVAEPSLADIDARIGELVAHERDWQEFEPKGLRTVEAALSTLRADRGRLDAIYAGREAERKRRIEEEERQRREHEEQIARAAAERATREAEEKARIAAAAVAAEAARREAELRAAAEREEHARQEAEKRIADEASRAAQAEAARQEAERRAAEEAVAAEQRHQAALQREREAAAEDERRRQAEEAEREAAAAAKREANLRHRAKINNEAKAALIAAGLSAGAAMAAIIAIAKGEIPHLTIAY